MEPEKISVEYDAYRWDGTIERAREICAAISWLKPTWRIREAPYEFHDQGMRLDIFEVANGSNGSRYTLNVGDALAVIVNDDGYVRPAKVIKAHD